MKKLNAIVFADESEFNEHADRIATTLSGLPEYAIYLGSWGEIRFNGPAVLSAISTAVNHFFASDKEEIFFGCCAKDYPEILAAIGEQTCEVATLPCQDL